MSKRVSKDEALKAVKTITDEISKSSLEKEALEAVKTLILWAGDDPEREGLVDTPKRVVKAYREFFSGYEENPEEILSRTFEEVEGYDDAVIVRNIRVESHCEHHMVPIVGVAHIGYIPRKRVVKAYKEFFSGYEEDPEEILSRTFEEVEGYDDAVIVRNIRVESHCEHHMVTIVGVAHIGYIPRKRVVGISKLARLVDLFGKRLQTQETMTAQIADTIDKVLQPKGVAVVIDANHQCMSTRGVHKTESSTITSRMLGTFRSDNKAREEFISLIHSPKKY